MSEETKAPNEMPQVTTLFTDENPAEQVEVGGEYPYLGQSSDVTSDLAEFFARPIELLGFDWDTDNGIQTKFSPWTLWSRNPRVANRLSNFSNFRGIMYVKLVLNGNPFYWGAAVMSYQPLGTTRFQLDDYSAAHIMQLTQRPCVYIDPTTSQGGTLRLPFFYEAPFIRLNTPGPLGGIGDITIASFVPLLHPTNTDPVRVQVFAWCENVELRNPTQVNIPNLVPQAGDEFKNKPVSRAAGIVEAISANLAKVPVISPYAIATQRVASVLGKAASALGFSKPSRVETPCTFRIQNVNNLAHVDDEDTGVKLSYALKNEVTIDPRSAGLDGVDEMAFEHFAGIESFYGTFQWNRADNYNQILFSTPVTPCLSRQYFEPGGDEGLCMIPAGYLAARFGSWRCDMVFRFHVAASAYHRGRLLVVWDPIGDSPGNPEMNVLCNAIIDISEKRDFAITVGWGQEALARQPRVSFDTFGNRTNSSWSVQANNGTLSVYVLNTLTSSGTDTSPVYINVFASAKNMQLWDPDNTQTALYGFFPEPLPLPAPPVEECETVPQAGWEFENNISPEDNIIFGTSAGEKDLFMMVGGEVVTSIRSMLKRYDLDQTIVVATPTLDATQMTRPVIEGNAWPTYRGWDVFGPDVQTAAGGAANCTVANMNQRAYFSACFAGWKGSTRFKLVRRPPTIYHASGAYGDNMVVSRGRGRNFGNATSYLPAFKTRAEIRASTVNNTVARGTTLITSISNGSIEFELPWYPPALWYECYVSPEAYSDNLGWQATDWIAGAVTESNGAFDLYSAVGEDFNLFYFIGVPILYPTNYLPS